MIQLLIKTRQPITLNELLIALSVLVLVYVIRELNNPRVTMYEEKKPSKYFKKPQNTGRLRIQKYYFIGLFMLRITIGDKTRKTLYIARAPRQYKKLFSYTRKLSIKNNA